MSTLLIPGTVALAAISTGSSSSNTILAANSNNTDNDGILKKQQLQQPLQLQQPKTHEYTLIAQDTTLQIAYWYWLEKASAYGMKGEYNGLAYLQEHKN